MNNNIYTSLKKIAVLFLFAILLITFGCKKSSGGNQPQPSHPTGTINGLFSVSDSTKVYFSKGNLQYRASTNVWRFAENQWDTIGFDNSNISDEYNGWIDMFGWGTGNNPTLFSFGDSDYHTYSEWGDNTISNGAGSSWRTMTGPEWTYLFKQRTTNSGLRFAKATIDGIKGVILLPDDWTSDYFILNNTNTTGGDFALNTISKLELKNRLEPHGAVFLPAGGFRFGNLIQSVNVYACYWTSTPYYDDFALYSFVGEDGGNISIDGPRHCGLCVRLVCDFK